MQKEMEKYTAYRIGGDESDFEKEIDSKNGHTHRSVKSSWKGDKEIETAGKGALRANWRWLQ